MYKRLSLSYVDQSKMTGDGPNTFSTLLIAYTLTRTEWCLKIPDWLAAMLDMFIEEQNHVNEKNPVLKDMCNVSQSLRF